MWIELAGLDPEPDTGTQRLTADQADEARPGGTRHLQVRDYDSTGVGFNQAHGEPAGRA